MKGPILACAVLAVALPVSYASFPGSSSAVGRSELIGVAGLSSDPAFEDHWGYCFDPPPNLQRTQRVAHEQPLYCYLLFMNYATDEEGVAWLEFDFEVTAPDGSSFASYESVEAWRGPSRPGRVLRSVATPLIAFDARDRLGTYTVEFVLTDRISGTTSRVRDTVELVEYAAGAGFANRAEVRDWIDGYYLDKDPARLIPALVTASTFGRPGELADTPWIGFFQAGFAENRWLLPYLAAEHATAEGDLRAAVAFLLAYLEADDALMARTLTPDELDAARDAAARAWSIDERVGRPADIDVLWGSFLATGRVAPIQYLVRVLGLDAERPGDDVLCAAAHGSLLSNARQHPLVRGYLETLTTMDGPPPQVTRTLEAILGELDASSRAESSATGASPPSANSR